MKLAAASTSAAQSQVEEETNEAFVARVAQEALNAEAENRVAVAQALEKSARADMDVVHAAAISPEEEIGLPEFLDPFALRYSKTPSVEEQLQYHGSAVAHSIHGDWSYANDQPSGLHFLRFRGKSVEGEVAASEYENIANYFYVPNINPIDKMFEERPATELKLGGKSGNERAKLISVKLHRPLDRQRCDSNLAFEVDLTFTSLRQGATAWWECRKRVFPADMNANDAIKEMLQIPSYTPRVDRNYTIAAKGQAQRGGVPATYYPKIN